MNHKIQVKMDRTKTKRRKSGAGKRHGRTEQKTKTTEVMNEKEKQDRLEAASALSSLMFFPPKSSNDESGETDKPLTPTATVTQFSVPPTTSGIPTTSQLTSLVQGVGGRGSIADTLVSDKAANLKNSLILAQLQNQLNLALKTRNVQPYSNPTTSSQTTVKEIPSDSSKSKDVKSNKDSQNVPLTVLPQNLTVNKSVAIALRQVVSNNILKAAEAPQTNDNLQTNETVNTDSLSGPRSPTEDQHEKMESESLPSSRKTGNSDTNLPLKKRRLIGVVEDSLSTADLTLTSSALNANLGTLNSTRQIEKIFQMAKDYPTASTNSTMSLNLVSGFSQPKLQSGEGYRPIQFDPRTSLMVLSDLKYALTPDDDGDLPIHIAVVHEKTELVKRFIDIMAISGKTVDRFNKLQQTPLHLAVLVDKPEIIDLLLEANANPNLLDRNGYTSLHIAVKKQLPSCMDTVFRNSKHPLKINTRDYEGYFPLHTCVELNNLSMMTSLIEQGAEKDCQDGKAGRSVLLYAVEYNRSKMVQYLLDLGANPDLQNYAGVSPMMTAQAANMDEIVSHLNKALDLVNKYEESYIPSKKVPIARIPSKSAQIIPSKSAQIINKETKTGRILPRSGHAPLIYQEYGGEPMSIPDEIKQEPLSRQSSVSSPIDLSMRNNSESPLPPPPELSIRGKPGRRKTKKEPKNHKEKQPQKSILKEKHASVVAALESRMLVDKAHVMKANSTTTDADYTMMESYVKVEKVDDEYDGTKNEAENEETVGIEFLRQKSSSEALSNLILGLRPDQTKYLVEKVKEQLSDNSRSVVTTFLSETPHRFLYTKPADKEVHNFEKQRETNPERMQVDLETDGNMSETDDNEKDLEAENSAKLMMNKDAGVCVVVSGKDISVSVPDAERIDNGDVNGVESADESTVMQVQVESRLQCSEENDKLESDEDDMVMEVRDMRSDERYIEHSKETSSEKNGTSLKFSSEDDPDNSLMNDASETEDISDKNIDDNSVLKDSQKSVGKVGNADINIPQNVEEKYLESMGKDCTAEKTLEGGKLVSQISQDSASSSSLHGSQGFEVTSGLGFCSSPLSKNNDLTKTIDKQLSHSENSMEVEFSGVDAKEGNQGAALIEKNESNADVEMKPKAEGNECESIVKEKESDAFVFTDEDDDENGLVIDEHLSEDENSKNVNKTEKSTKGYSKTVNLGNEKVEETDTGQLDEDKRLSDNVDNIEKGGYTDSMSEVEVGNKDSEKIVKDNELKSNVIEGKKHIENHSVVGRHGSSKGKNGETFETISESVRIKSSPVLNENSSNISSGSLQGTEKILKPENSKGPTQSVSTENLLKKGQSHTLYYHDGDSYKPVKIFIDNSEQSSLVLQRMFQTTQLSNLKRQGGVDDSGNFKGPSPESAESETKKLASASSANSNSIGSLSDISISHHDNAYEVRGRLINTTVVSSSSSLSKETIPTASVMLSSLASNPLGTPKDYLSFQQAYVESLKIKADELSVFNNSSEQGKKRTVGHATKKAVVQSASKTENKAKTTSEGTLTRVNPDIRSKLSKALQSPQRKVGLVRSDSDVCIVNTKEILGNALGSVPCTVNTSVSDTRQQL